MFEYHNHAGNGSMTYGKVRVIRQHAQGDVLRVWVEDIETGGRRFVTVALTTNGR